MSDVKDEELKEVDGGLGGLPWCTSYNAYQARTHRCCPIYDTCPTKGLCKATKQGEVKD